MVDVISTVIGGQKTAEAIAESKALLGFESGNAEPNRLPDFVDYPFTKEDVGFRQHLYMVQKYEPRYAVAPDIEKGLQLSEAIRMADELSKFAEEVIVVPKSVQPQDVPDRFIVGLPNQPKFGSNGGNTVWSYNRAERVHILGGSPASQLEKARYLDNVVSVDSASPLKAAKFGDIWDDGWQERPDLTFYQRITLSMNNLHARWNNI